LVNDLVQMAWSGPWRRESMVSARPVVGLNILIFGDALCTATPLVG
jgi:hypothetical protein